MTNDQDKINQPLDKLKAILKRKEFFRREVNGLLEKIYLQKSYQRKQLSLIDEIKTRSNIIGTTLEFKKEKAFAACKSQQQLNKKTLI